LALDVDFDEKIFPILGAQRPTDTAVPPSSLLYIKSHRLEDEF
jgi:hypothetical protein